MSHGRSASRRRRRCAAGCQRPKGSHRDAVVFTLFADELDGSPVAVTAIEAYDVLGRSLEV